MIWVRSFSFSFSTFANSCLYLVSNSLFLFFSWQLSVSGPFLSFWVFINNCFITSFRNDLSYWFLLSSLNSSRCLSDFLMDFFIKCFQRLNFVGSKSLFPFGKLSSEFFFLFFLQVIHVTLNMETEYVVSVFFRNPIGGWFSFFGWFSLFSFGLSSLFNVVTRESLVVMRNVKTSINSTFHCSEDSVTSSGSNESNIEVSFEWSLFNFFCHDVEVFSINILNTLEFVSQFQIVQESSG